MVSTFNTAQVVIAPPLEAADVNRGSDILGTEGIADSTGHAAWRGLGLLVDFLLTPQGKHLCAEAAHVLELGAGLGVPGLLAGREAARLTLTDNNAVVLERLERSIVCNMALLRAPNLASVQPLEWGASHMPDELRGAVDLVLAADCVYSSAATVRLFETAAALLSPSGCMLLAYVSRWSHLDHKLLEIAAEAGAAWRRLSSVPPPRIRPQPAVPNPTSFRQSLHPVIPPHPTTPRPIPPPPHPNAPSSHPTTSKAIAHGPLCTAHRSSPPH